MSDIKGIEINRREAYLVLKYGYPFEDEEKQLKEFSRVNGWHRFVVSEFYLEHIIADICRSMREVQSTRLIEELDSLCATLEMALKGAVIRVEE